MKGEVQIQTSLRNNITFLQKAYCTPPFKVGNITEDKKNNVLRLMLMSSSPGILDGDHYRITVDVGENNALVLSSQSYQRLFAMQKGASQEIKVTIGNGGVQ